MKRIFQLVLLVASSLVLYVPALAADCVTLDDDTTGNRRTRGAYATPEQHPWAQRPDDVCENDQIVLGFDVKSDNGLVDMAAEYRLGARWVYIRATYIEQDDPFKPIDFTKRGKLDPRALHNRQAARNAGLLVGHYHHAQASTTLESAYTQAYYLAFQGGNWCAWSDEVCLPGAVELDPIVTGRGWPYNCDGLNSTQYRDWVYNFAYAYWDLTKRTPIVLVSDGVFGACLDKSMERLEAIPFWISGINFPNITLEQNLYGTWIMRQLHRRQASGVDHYDWFRLDLETLKSFARSEQNETAAKMRSLPHPHTDLSGVNPLTSCGCGYGMA